MTSTRAGRCLRARIATQCWPKRVAGRSPISRSSSREASSKPGGNKEVLLETSDRSLHFSTDEIRRAGELLVEFAIAYEQGIHSTRIFPALDRTALDELLHAPFPRDGIGIEALFS